MGGLRLSRYAKTMFMGKRAVCCLAFLVAGILAIGCGESENTSGQVGPTIVASVSPTQAPATPSPTAEASTPLPTPSPTVVPQPTLPAPPTVDMACKSRTHNHVNIDRLLDQPSLTDAAITEIDANTIRVDFEGVVVTVEGWAELVTVDGELSAEQQERLFLAIDAVRYVC